MNEEQKRKALEDLLTSQQQETDRERIHRIAMEGISPESPQMEEAMNMAGGAMGAIGKAPKILKSIGPSRFSNIVKQGIEGGYSRRLAPELEGLRSGTLTAEDPIMKGLRNKLNQASDVVEQQKLMHLIEKYGIKKP